LRGVKWLEPYGEEERDRWRRLLVHTLSQGWERSRKKFFGGRSDGHVFDAIAKQSEIAEAFGKKSWREVLPQPSSHSEAAGWLADFAQFLKESPSSTLR